MSEKGQSGPGILCGSRDPIRGSHARLSTASSACTALDLPVFPHPFPFASSLLSDPRRGSRSSLLNLSATSVSPPLPRDVFETLRFASPRSCLARALVRQKSSRTRQIDTRKRRARGQDEGERAAGACHRRKRGHGKPRRCEKQPIRTWNASRAGGEEGELDHAGTTLRGAGHRHAAEEVRTRGDTGCGRRWTKRNVHQHRSVRPTHRPGCQR